MSNAKKAAATSGDVPKVWVTKYALTIGIRLCECHELDDKYGYIRWPGTIGGTMLVSRKDVHHTLEAAQERAKFLATKNIGNLEKQIAKMKQVARDGAKVVEDK